MPQATEAIEFKRARALRGEAESASDSVPAPLPEAPAPRIVLDDGAYAARRDGALELHDAEGRLLFSYRNGSAELVAPSGDLRLSAPRGSIKLDAQGDVEICSSRDVVQRPARRAAIEVQGSGMAKLEVDKKTIRASADELAVVTRRSELATGEATVLARKITTKATEIATVVQRYELTARRIVEKSKEAFRDVQGLLQTKAGRTRTIVEGVCSLFTRRTVMVSDKDTSIDGSKVLLG